MGSIFIENPRRGGGFSRRGRGRGAGRVCLWRIGEFVGGGGAKVFFCSGPKCPPSKRPPIFNGGKP